MTKKYDAVKWMRERRAQIDEEDRGLSWPDKRRKTRQAVMQDPLLAPLAGKTVSPDTLRPMVTKEP